MSFKSRIEESNRERGSNIVLALDLFSENTKDLFEKSIQILEDSKEYLCALKINHHLVLPLGLFNGVKKIVEKAHRYDLPVIMDCKINDIGNTNRIIAENYFKVGFDAVIANPFVGWEEGLQPVFELAQEKNRGVILLVYMSHKASNQGYGQTICENPAKTQRQYEIFAERAIVWKADGAVVGATYPDKISEVHAILRDEVPIYSPGIGAQGGDLKAALSSGARYFIVGRSIVEAEKPGQAAKTIRDAAATASK